MVAFFAFHSLTTGRIFGEHFTASRMIQEGIVAERVSLRQIDPDNTIEIRTGACADMYVNGRRIYSQCGYRLYGGRGFNFVLLDTQTKTVLESKAFDTWINGNAWREMADYVKAIPDGTLVLVSTGDDIGVGNSVYMKDGLRALEGRLGLQRIREYGFRDSWAAIGIAGDTKPIVESFLAGYGLSIVWRFGTPIYRTVQHTLRGVTKFEWLSWKGATYQLERSTDLTQWYVTGQKSTGTGEQMASIYLDFPEKTAKEFFRLRIKH